MFTLADVDPSVLFAMFKGEPGTRKSTQALSFPRPQYWFSWDKKMKALAIPMRKFGINPREIHADNYSDWEAARKKLEQFQLECKYKTLVVDSITSGSDATLRQTMKLKRGVKRQSGADAGKSIAGIQVNEGEDYGAESAALTEMIALLKDINEFHKVNIVLIAHVIQADYRDTFNKETHISRTIVTAAKKIAAKIPAYCEEVYHFNIKKSFNADEGGQYALLTEHTGDDFARTALPLPKEIIFGEQSLYDVFLNPAIKTLVAEQALAKGQQVTEKKEVPTSSFFTTPQ